MTSRISYLSLLLAVAGGFVVLATFAFSAGTANWIAFGIAVGTALAGTATIATRPPGRRYLAGAAATTLIGAWTVLVTLGIFSGATQRWLVFAAGAAIAAIALAGAAATTRALTRRLAELEADPFAAATNSHATVAPARTAA